MGEASKSAGIYTLGRVRDEAGTADPIQIWKKLVAEREITQAMINSFNRNIENQRVIIETQKQSLLEGRDQVSALRRQIRKAGIEPCV